MSTPFAGPIFLSEEGTPFHNTKISLKKRIWVEKNGNSNELTKAHSTETKVTIA